MKRVTAIGVALILLSAPVGADEPPAESNESPTQSEETPASPAEESANTDEPSTEGSESPASTEGETASPAGEPADTRPDFATIKKHLVVVKDGLENAEQAPGFVISNQGHIVTYAGKLRKLRDEPYLVSTATDQVFPAAKIKADEHTGLWILQLSDSGHGLTGLPFARTALQAAAPLHAVNFNPSGSERFTLTPGGTVTKIENTEQGQMIQHNALFSLTSAGTPLLNRCFQAVGVNVLEKQGFFRQSEVDPAQAKTAQSLAAASLGRLLASRNLTLPVADSECLSLEEETQQKLEQARQEQEAARQRQEAADQQAQEAAQEALQREQREKEAAQEQARQAAAQTEAERQRAAQERQEQQAELQRQQDEAQRREAALQREKEEAEQRAAQRQRQILLYGSIIGGLILLGVLLLIRRKQKRLRTTEQEKRNIAGALGRAQSELSNAAEQEQLRSSAPDVFLEGKTPPIALKIPGVALVEQAGAVVGRSPAASTFVINHEQVSRQHFRLSLVAQQVMLEDLGSTNGTSVDGVPLEAGQQRPVSDGSRLGLGDLELTLHICG